MMLYLRSAAYGYKILLPASFLSVISLLLPFYAYLVLNPFPRRLTWAPALACPSLIRRGTAPPAMACVTWDHRMHSDKTLVKPLSWFLCPCEPAWIN